MSDDHVKTKLTVMAVLQEHRLDVRTDPGKGNQCSCGWWEWGQDWALHVANELAEAGVLRAGEDTDSAKRSQ